MLLQHGFTRSRDGDFVHKGESRERGGEVLVPLFDCPGSVSVASTNLFEGDTHHEWFVAASIGFELRFLPPAAVFLLLLEFLRQRTRSRFSASCLCLRRNDQSVRVSFSTRVRQRKRARDVPLSTSLRQPSASLLDPVALLSECPSDLVEPVLRHCRRVAAADALPLKVSAWVDEESAVERACCRCRATRSGLLCRRSLPSSRESAHCGAEAMGR